jgi:integrase
MSITKRVTDSGTVSWQVKWRESGRGSRQRSRSFATRRDAQAFQAEIRRRSRLGAHAPGDASPERLEVWLHTWFESNRHVCARSTAIRRASVINRWIVPYLGDVRLRDLGAARVRQWRDDITTAGSTPGNTGNVMRVLSAALGAAVVDDKLPANPIGNVKRPPVIREPRQALSAEQAETLRAELPTQRDRVLWGLLYAAGLRTEEALALRWSDLVELSRVGAVLKVDRVWVAGEFRNTTKTRVGRDVPVVAPLSADLIDLMAECAPIASDALVCPSQVGTPLNPNNWRARIFNAAAEAAGLSWATPYTGRHTYISLQIHAGLSPVTVAAYAGNSPDIIWRHYAREFERSRTSEALSLEGALGAARRAIAVARVPVVFPGATVVQLDDRRNGRKNAV